MNRDDGPTLMDYALVALLRLGGDSSMVDIEDIAVESYRLAPRRFRWRRHDYPDHELVRVVLSDANKRGLNLVLVDRKGRMLSVDGVRRATDVLHRLNLADAPDLDSTLRRKSLADLARMEAHPAYLRWRLEGIKSVDAVDLADLARCSSSAPFAVFIDRLRRSQAFAVEWKRDDLARFLSEAVEQLPTMLTGGRT